MPEDFLYTLDRSAVLIFEIKPRSKSIYFPLTLRDAGLVGNTHIPFAEMNNVEVAHLLSDFLSVHGLD